VGHLENTNQSHCEQKGKSNQTKARPIERKLQQAINCSVYFSSLFLPFDIRLFVQIVFGLMLIGYLLCTVC
jgi:hypothetical protein